MFFRKKEINKNFKKKSKLKKVLNVFDLIFLGVGAIFGTGIFVIPGIGMCKYSGPSLIISFLISAIIAIFSGFCYAEFSSRILIPGGGYSYIFVVFGEFVAWIFGWFSICEFFFAVVSIALGWSSYIKSLFLNFFKDINFLKIDIFAILILLFSIFVVSLDAKKVLSFNGIIVFIKFLISILFIIIGIPYIKNSNFSNFIPYGISGIFSGVNLVFFSFLGFESVSLASDEVINPKKNIPIGIFISIIISSIFYIIISIILAGIINFKMLNVGDPLSFAMRFVGQYIVNYIITCGVIITLLSVIVSMMYGLVRLVYSISKDGLLPKFFSHIDKKSCVPKKATYILGILAIIFSIFFTIEILTEIVNIVTLSCLIIINLGIIVLRKDYGMPKKNEFKMPLVPFIPILLIIFELYLMSKFKILTWKIYILILILGIIFYFLYGYYNSNFNKKNKKKDVIKN